MFSKTTLAVLALVGSTVAQFCPEALRFGSLASVSPEPIVLGQVSINDCLETSH